MGESCPYDEKRAAMEKIDHELSVIEDKGLAGYFLICWDIVRFARSRGIRTLGRGSAGNSLVSYALGITHFNPLRHNMFFERFLNPEREHLPDFDLDFGTDDREIILKYIFRRYGKDHVAMIGTFSTLRARSALRETAKALGIPEGEIRQFIRAIPFYASIDRLDHLVKVSPRAAGLPVDQGAVPYPHRDRTEDRRVPAAHGDPSLRARRLARAYHRHDPDAARRQGVRDNAVVDVRGRGGGARQDRHHRAEGARRDRRGVRDGRGERGAARCIRSASITSVTRRRRNCCATGRTEGCFYIESPIMMQLMSQARCDDFEVLTALSSIIRPGVSSHGGKRSYLHRALGLEEVTDMHPAVAAVLRDTYGCLIYQEQVIRLAVAVAGMSYGEADGLRRCMSFKNIDGETMESLPRGLSARGARARDPRRDGGGCLPIRSPHSPVTPSARPTRPRSRSSRSRAPGGRRTTRPSSWRRSSPTAADTTVTRSISRRRGGWGLSFFRPASTGAACAITGAGGELRVGLMQVKGLTSATIEAIVGARPFESLSDFIGRVPASQSEIESLVRCGAFACFGRTRPELMWELRVMKAADEETEPDVPSMLGLVPELPDFDLRSSLEAERETLDMCVAAHPLVMFEEALDDLHGRVRAHQLGRPARPRRERGRPGRVEGDGEGDPHDRQGGGDDIRHILRHAREVRGDLLPEGLPPRRPRALPGNTAVRLSERRTSKGGMSEKVTDLVSSPLSVVRVAFAVTLHPTSSFSSRRGRGSRPSWSGPPCLTGHRAPAFEHHKRMSGDAHASVSRSASRLDRRSKSGSSGTSPSIDGTSEESSSAAFITRSSHMLSDYDPGTLPMKSESDSKGRAPTIASLITEVSPFTCISQKA